MGGATVTLSGGGTVNAIFPGGSFSENSGHGYALANVDNTIQGDIHFNGDITLNNEVGGTFNANDNTPGEDADFNGLVANAGLMEASNGGGLDIDNSLTNSGTIRANAGSAVSLGGTDVGSVSNTGLLQATGGGGSLLSIHTSLTNNGTIEANAGSNVDIEDNLTNYSTGTLTGGSYIVNGAAGQTATLSVYTLGQDPGGEIATNAANIVLNGPSANTLVTNERGYNALTPLAANQGSFTLDGGYGFASGGDFANSGTISVGAASSLTIGASGSNTRKPQDQPRSMAALSPRARCRSRAAPSAGPDRSPET